MRQSGRGMREKDGGAWGCRGARGVVGVAEEG